MNRKLLSMLAILVLLAFVTGCGKNATDESKGKSAGNSSASSNSSSTSNSGTSTSNSSGTSSTSPTSSQKKEEAKKTYEKVKVGPLKVGEAAKVGPLTVTLKSTAVVDKAAGLPQGYVHLMTEITVANEASDPYTLNITDHFKLETPEGKKAPYNIQATANRSPRLQGTLEKDQNTTGWIGYLSKKVGGKYKYMFTHPDYGEATWEFAIQ